MNDKIPLNKMGAELPGNFMSCVPPPYAQHYNMFPPMMYYPFSHPGMAQGLPQGMVPGVPPGFPMGAGQGYYPGVPGSQPFPAETLPITHPPTIPDQNEISQNIKPEKNEKGEIESQVSEVKFEEQNTDINPESCIKEKSSINYFADSDEEEELNESDISEKEDSKSPREVPQELNAPPKIEEEEKQSSLVKRFFYREEEKKAKEKMRMEQKKKITETTQANTIIDQKIEELNQGIEQLKIEKDKLRFKKFEGEKMAKKLQKEVEEFQKLKQKEMADFEEYRKEEIQKLKKERRFYEKQHRAMQNNPNRKEREEIERLKKEVQQLREELKIKDSKHKHNSDRYKKQIDELTSLNVELRSEVKVLEDLRLNNWQSTKPAPLKKAFQSRYNPPSSCKENFPLK